MPLLAAFAPEIFGECEPFASKRLDYPRNFAKHYAALEKAPTPLGHKKAARRRPSKDRLRFMYLSQNCRCWFCGDELLGVELATVDHLTPIARGGTNDWANIVLACSYCNGRKAAKTLDEYRTNPRVSNKGRSGLFYGEAI